MAASTASWTMLFGFVAIVLPPALSWSRRYVPAHTTFLLKSRPHVQSAHRRPADAPVRRSPRLGPGRDRPPPPWRRAGRSPASWPRPMPLTPPVINATLPENSIAHLPEERLGRYPVGRCAALRACATEFRNSLA